MATETRRYLHGPNVDQILAEEDAANTVLWDLTDHLGTVRDLVNGAGQVVNHLKYDSYGNIINQSDATKRIRYLYTGREFDAETSLYYYRARYYDAVTGRFLSEDPIGFRASDSNLYRYVGANPISRRDPTGLEYTKQFWTEIFGYLDQGQNAYENGANDITVADASAPAWYGQESIHSAASKFSKAYMRLPRRTDRRCMSDEQRKKLEAGRQNALRHAFWQAALAALYGNAQAEIIGNAHESRDPEHRSWDSLVDLVNNARGREIGNSLRKEPWFSYLSRGEQFARVADAVLNAYDQGRLNLKGG